ncbi:sigma-70 family RNA polymerase sigma factor [Planctomicrobium sp. SH664]|uniref:sigma-70 family RNA polymerase sigma factor n=1 Tax=Planctomicrobium sp. SH664 TaxID=3448125 RepID=UPI003F5B6A64
MDDRFKELAKLWTRHLPVVEAYFVSLWVSSHDMEELLQETVTQLFQKAETYDFERPFVPWLLGIARNVVLRHRRDFARNRYVFSQEAVENLSRAFEEVSESQDSLRRFLGHCLSRLSDAYRRLCQLRYEENLGRDEIARLQGTSASAVKMGLHRLRSQLRECITRKLQSEVRT